MFLERRPRAIVNPWCRWCCRRVAQRDVFRLIDGPVTHDFCDEGCADRYILYRHSDLTVNAALKLCPCEREHFLQHFGVASIDQLISQSGVSNNAASTSAGVTTDAVRHVHHSRLSMHENA